MPWIQNVSLADVRKGHHIRIEGNAMLIQIVDPAMEFPTPFHKFKEVHQFQFLDVEEKDEVLDEEDDEDLDEEGSGDEFGDDGKEELGAW